MSTIFTIPGVYNKLDTKEDISRHLDNIADLSAVNEVRLSKNSVGVDAAAALGAAFTQMTSLKVLAPPNVIMGGWY